MKSSTCRCLIKLNPNRQITIDMLRHKETIKDQSTLMGITEAVNTISSKSFRFIEDCLFATGYSKNDKRCKIVIIGSINYEEGRLIREQ